MKRPLPVYLILFLFLTGCATTQKTPLNFDNESKEFIPEVVQVSKSISKTDKVHGEEGEEVIENSGVVFAKTEFGGVLKTSYVRLKIQDINNFERTYQLHIGEKGIDAIFPWEVKTVNPGYFYIELPEGDYQITSVSIPVGSTTAMEEIDIRFSVFPDEIAYLGTLKMNGTKEKIKLGGDLPLIKPGFEFTTEIINQFDDAKQALQDRFPNVPGDISPQIMIIP